MRARNVFTTLGLGAFALLCLTPDSAQAQRRRMFGGGGGGSSAYYPSAPSAYGQGYAGQGYYPGMPGVAYGQGCGDIVYPASSDLYGPRAQMFPPQPFAAPPSPMPGTAPGYAPPSPMPGPGTGQPGTGQPGATQAVTANDDVFEPKAITIRPGTTVTWTNRGHHPHTVTFAAVGRDSGDIPPGGSFSATFPHVGTYTYNCRHHRGMTGTVVVGPAGGTGTSDGSSINPKVNVTGD
ncbi:MAG: cupredoxin domain-containing protein [Actinobacteria bacterium]|nr:cupredoxin domain-containing protein [Actinomycetota bacterium]